MPYLRLLVRTLTFAGMDTTSSALARILFLLAQHQDVQDKLRSEIRQARLRQEAKQDGTDFGYDDLESMVYLEGVVRETLRLFVGCLISALHDFLTVFLLGTLL
jgi:cytochrome P450